MIGRDEGIALVGQLVDLFERHMDNPNAVTKFSGVTTYNLSEITKIPQSTLHGYLSDLIELGYVDYVVQDYKNTTRKLYAPTNKAVSEWRKLRHTSAGNDARAFVASKWMQWYKKEQLRIAKKYKLRTLLFRS